ncbi:hypothetical protein JCM10213_002468 [Rhodosporidiobolus nylandii]
MSTENSPSSQRRSSSRVAALPEVNYHRPLNLSKDPLSLTALKQDIAKRVDAGKVRLPASSASFPSSRALAVELHAYSRQQGFRLYGCSLNGGEYRLFCSSHPKGGGCTFRLTMAPDEGTSGQWRLVTRNLVHSDPDGQSAASQAAGPSRKTAPSPNRPPGASGKIRKLSERKLGKTDLVEDYRRLASQTPSLRLPGPNVAFPTARALVTHVYAWGEQQSFSLQSWPLVDDGISFICTKRQTPRGGACNFRLEATQYELDRKWYLTRKCSNHSHPVTASKLARPSSISASPASKPLKRKHRSPSPSLSPPRANGKPHRRSSPAPSQTKRRRFSSPPSLDSEPTAKKLRSTVATAPDGHASASHSREAASPPPNMPPASSTSAAALASLPPRLPLPSSSTLLDPASLSAFFAAFSPPPSPSSLECITALLLRAGVTTTADLSLLLLAGEETIAVLVECVVADGLASAEEGEELLGVLRRVREQWRSGEV